MAARTDLYMPEPQSLAGRVCAWFKRHPEDELSAADIGHKFDVATLHLVRDSLEPAVVHQLLVIDPVKRAGAAAIYRAGANFRRYLHPANGEPMAAGNGSHLPSLRTPPPSTVTKAAASLPEIDLARVDVKKGVPKPRVRAHGQFKVYDPVIAKLTVGDMVELPTAHAKRLIGRARDLTRLSSQQDATKPVYSIRRLSPTTSGVWRDS